MAWPYCCQSSACGLDSSQPAPLRSFMTPPREPSAPLHLGGGCDYPPNADSFHHPRTQGSARLLLDAFQQVPPLRSPSFTTPLLDPFARVHFCGGCDYPPIAASFCHSGVRAKRDGLPPRYVKKKRLGRCSDSPLKFTRQVTSRAWSRFVEGCHGAESCLSSSRKTYGENGR